MELLLVVVAAVLALLVAAPVAVLVPAERLPAAEAARAELPAAPPGTEPSASDRAECQ